MSLHKDSVVYHNTVTQSQRLVIRDIAHEDTNSILRHVHTARRRTDERANVGNDIMNIERSQIWHNLQRLRRTVGVEMTMYNMNESVITTSINKMIL